MSTLLESWQAKIAAPFAVLAVRTAGEQVMRIDYLPPGAALLEPQTAFAREACRQLKAFLQDPRFAFDLPFSYEGTAFQIKVWKAIWEIPAGSVLS